MRSRAYPGVLLALVVLVSGTSCDTDQPALLGEQIAEILFDAPGATVEQFDIWELYQDLDNNNMPDNINGDPFVDDKDVTLWCESKGATVAFSAPWYYSVEVSVLRAGQTVAQKVTTAEALTEGRNMACYDTFKGTNNIGKNPANVMHKRGMCSGNNAVICNPDSQGKFCSNVGAGNSCIPVFNCTGDFTVVCDPNAPDPCPGLGNCVDTITRRFRFRNPTRLTQASRRVLTAETNFIYGNCLNGNCSQVPVVNSPQLGRCPGFKQAGASGVADLGMPRIDGDMSFCDVEHPALELNVEKGDTILVQAKRFDTTPQPIVLLGGTGPTISASVVLNGIGLQADEVTGDTGTGPNSTSSIDFFFTAN